MANDERIKKKVGKLLTKWSVPDAEKVEFLKELEEEIAKPDEEEDLEGVAEETETKEVKEESPNEEVGEEEVEEKEVSEVAEEPAETEPTEEPVEEPLPEEPVAEEPVAEEQPGEELPVEEPPVEENPMEQPMEQPQPANDPRVEEMSKTIEGLTDRIASLEDIVKKLGTPVEENIGVEPHNPSGESLQESELDHYNKLRMGR